VLTLIWYWLMHSDRPFFSLTVKGLTLVVWERCDHVHSSKQMGSVEFPASDTFQEVSCSDTSQKYINQYTRYMRDTHYKTMQNNKHSLTKEIWDGKSDEGPEWVKVHAAVGKWCCDQLQARNYIKVKRRGMMSGRWEWSELSQDNVIFICLYNAVVTLTD
jgi:hypothetical protein